MFTSLARDPDSAPLILINHQLASANHNFVRNLRYPYHHPFQISRFQIAKRWSPWDSRVFTPSVTGHFRLLLLVHGTFVTLHLFINLLRLNHFKDTEELQNLRNDYTIQIMPSLESVTAELILAIVNLHTTVEAAILDHSENRQNPRSYECGVMILATFGSRTRQITNDCLLSVCTILTRLICGWRTPRHHVMDGAEM